MKNKVNIGLNVKSLRVKSGMSIRALAKKTGFSHSFIFQVENGQTSPSLASLERIASALGASLGEFFNTDEPTAPVLKATFRQEITSLWSKARIEALGPIGAGHKMEPVMVTIEVGGRSSKQPYAHPGEEFAIVFEGEVNLILEDQRYILQRGDSTTFSSTIPHLWENKGEEPVRIIIVSPRFSH